MKSWRMGDACPSCQQTLRLSGLECQPCGLKTTGPLEPNEFSFLGGEELHLLRIFLRSEGKIREMESPLGLSYPTLRTRISELNRKLQRLQAQLSSGQNTLKKSTKKTSALRGPETLKILEQLQNQEISFDESIKRLKTRKGVKS